MNKRKNLLLTIAGLGAVALLGCCLLSLLGNLFGTTEHPSGYSEASPAAPVERLPTLTVTALPPAPTLPAPTSPPTEAATATPIPATAQPLPLPTAAIETPTVMPTPIPTEVPVPTVAAPIPPPSDGGDRNCDDFPSQAEAQAFYEGEGGPAIDPHDLDRDRDGVACENTNY